MPGLPAVPPAQILLVEDDENYAFLARRALGEAKLPANLHHVDDGRKCLQFLRKESPYTEAPHPDIVLLDLEMPVMDGREVLAEIVKDEALRHLAVVVLTGREEQAEIMRMYRLRCNSYVCKPRDFDKYIDMMKRLADYWFSLVALPRRSGGAQAPGD